MHLSSGLIGLDVNYLANNAFTAAAAVANLNVLMLTQFVCYRAGLINRLGMFQTAAGGAGSVGRFGAYLTNPATGGPVGLAPVADSGTIAFDAANGLKSFNPNLLVSYGQAIWLATLFGVAAPTVHQYNFSGGGSGGLGISIGPTSNCSAFVAQAFGALPNPCPGPIALVTYPQPAIFVQYA